MKKKEENVFPLPGFPSVSKQFTANGFADNLAETVQEVGTSGSGSGPNGELRSPRKQPSKKGKR